MEHKKYAVFTIDVESFADTECIQSSGVHIEEDLVDGLEEYIQILDGHGIKGTLFTVGDFAPKIADGIRRYIANGHSLALHNFAHIPPMSVPLEQFREKNRQAKARMKELFGVNVVGFRAPCFSMDKERLDVLRELGFLYDSSHLDFLAARHTVKLDLDDFHPVRETMLRLLNDLPMVRSVQKFNRTVECQVTSAEIHEFIVAVGNMHFPLAWLRRADRSAELEKLFLEVTAKGEL